MLSATSLVGKVSQVAGCALLQICVLGGHNGSAWLEGVTTHRPHSNNWGRLPILDSARSFAAADSWRDNVFVMGGGDGAQWFNTVLRCVLHSLTTVAGSIAGYWHHACCSREGYYWWHTCHDLCTLVECVLCTHEGISVVPQHVLASACLLPKTMHMTYAAALQV